MSDNPITNRNSNSSSFYTYISIVAALMVFAGFARTYYLKGAFGTPDLRSLLHIHGMVMTLWFALFIVQVRMVATYRIDIHRRVGAIGAVLAVLMVVVNVAVAITGAKRGYTPGPPPLVFMVVPLVDMLVFAILVTLALLVRRSRNDIHRRLMPLATLSILTPAISRIPIEFVHAAGIPMYLGLTDLCLLACVAFDTVKNRRLHPASGWGVVFIIASQPLRMLLAGTSAWIQFATWLVS